MGLGALFGAHLRTARYGGRLRPVCPEGPLLRILDVTGLRRVVPVHSTVAEALLSSPKAGSSGTVTLAPDTGCGRRDAGGRG